MNLPYYILISKSESIELTKNRVIELPLSTRMVDDCGDQDKLVSTITSRLSHLNINEDSDYLLLLINASKGNNNLVTLKISDVLNQYCFTDGALTFYQTRVNPHYSYKIISDISLRVDIESVIQEVKNNKIIELIEEKDVFNISIKDLPIDTERDYSELINFKRECKLVKNDLSYFNDLVTIGILIKNSGSVNPYKAGNDIAGKSNVLAEINDKYTDKSIKQLLLCPLDAIPQMNNLNDTLKSALDPELDNFSFVVFVLVYLKTFGLYQNAENKVSALYAGFNDLLEVNQFQLEIKSAYYLFLRNCGYDNLYTDYYQFKKLKINTGSDEFSYSVLRAKLNEANSQIESFNETLAELDSLKQRFEQMESELIQKQFELAKFEQENKKLSSELRSHNEQQTQNYQASIDYSDMSTVQSPDELIEGNQSNDVYPNVPNESAQTQQINNNDLYITYDESSSIIIPGNKLTKLSKTNLNILLSIEKNHHKKMMIEELLKNKR